jgi:serine/threonine protein phosphatase 1
LAESDPIAFLENLNNIKYRQGPFVVFGASVTLAPPPASVARHIFSRGRTTVWNSRLLQNQRALARLPDGLRIYGIGDIHGCADLLAALLRQIDVDCTLYPSSRPIVVFIGDYIDRGPASKEVLDLLLGCERTKETVFLKGNHENFVHRFLSAPAVLDEWRFCGGLETLMSYGLKPSINPSVPEQRQLAKALAKSIPKTHLEFLDSLKLSFNCGDFLFVHAGIRPGVPIREQSEEDLLWIREEFLSCEQQFEKFVVHGHTPVAKPDIRSNRINIDTGAFATGRLTCMMIEGTVVMPLIDVREWMRNAAGIGVDRNTQTRMKRAA